ncbi:MAG: hypothetical protein FIA98_10100, partial [Anaerolineae bacterium]|nr:hypothetical protein [Anaerolineae bacterium]
MHLPKTHTTAQVLCLIIIITLIGASLPSCQPSKPTVAGEQITGTDVQSTIETQSINPEASDAVSEQPLQTTTGSANPSVLGFVFDPDVTPVPYALVADAITDINGAVSGDLEGSSEGWLAVKSLGYATSFTRPGTPINGPAFFESRLTPFQAFLLVNSGEEARLEVGEAGQLQAGISIPADSVSPLPTILEATTVNVHNIG